MSQVRDGFSRSELKPFVLELKNKYGARIPSYFWQQVTDEILTTNQVLAITQTVLSELKQTLWKAEINLKKQVFSVDVKTHTLTIPNKIVTSRELQAVLAHELLVHVLRWTHGEKALPRYKIFEEGLATSIQFYILGNEIIPYGRNKVRDILILFWELGVDDNRLEKYWECIKPIAPVSKNNYSWMKGFLQRLHSHTISKKSLRKYKMYTLGVRRFEKFIRRYHSTNPIIADIAHELTTTMLDYKFDALNPAHLIHLKNQGILQATEKDLQLFCQKDSHKS